MTRIWARRGSLPTETDTQAPFGGVIVTNRPLTEGLARIISSIFTDVIIAPDFESEARAILQKKKNLRLIKLNTEAWEGVRKKSRDPLRSRRAYGNGARPHHAWAR